MTPALPRPFPGGLLRRMRRGDLTDFQAYRRDPEVARYQGWTSMDDAAALAFIDEMASAPLWTPGAWLQIAIASPDDVRLLGDIGLCIAADGRTVEIGYTLATHAQRRGLATAAVRAACDWAFETTAVDRVVAITDARNAPSIRLLERAGFVHQQTHSAVFRGRACLEHEYVRERAVVGWRTHARPDA
jgi:RimJ/RimL family protein N-acetyltransferase